MARRLATWAAVVSLVAAGGAEAASVITTGSNVRIRDAANTDAPVITMVPLGTALDADAAGTRDGWLAVTVPATSTRGWVHESLVTPVTPADFLDVSMRLMDARLARRGDGLQARRELLDFIESTAAPPGDTAIAAELQLRRLRAMQEVLYAIPWRRSTWDLSIKDWIARHARQITYNEPGGNWLLRREYMHSLHDECRGTPAADDIAWHAVLVGLGGECEGFLVCYLQRIDAVEAEYLRRQPRGAHVEEAVDMISRRIGRLMDEQPVSGRVYFSTQSECAPMQEAISALQAAVQGSNATSAPTLVARLRSFTCAHAQGVSRSSD